MRSKPVMSMDPMWFYDEERDLEDWHDFRKKAEELERQHLRIRVAIRDAEAVLRGDPAKQALKDRVYVLERELQELNEKAPWIAADYPMEVLLWGAPHG